ncbi:hypothetical protein Tco_1076101, partial [Tanacetum coccineum]
MVDFVSGRAVIDAAHRKRVKYEAKYEAKCAVTLLKRIRKFSMTQDIGARAAIHIFNRISFAIAKGVRLLMQHLQGASDYTTKRMEQDYELEDMFCSDGVIILNNYVLSSSRWNIIRDSFTEDLKMENMIAKSNHEITYSELNINCKHVSLFEAADAVQKAELLKPLVAVTGETEIKDDDAYKEELLDYEERDEKAPYSAAMSANGNSVK